MKGSINTYGSERREQTIRCTVSEHNAYIKVPACIQPSTKKEVTILIFEKYFLHSVHNEIRIPYNVIFETKILWQNLAPKSKQGKIDPRKKLYTLMEIRKERVIVTCIPRIRGYM